MTALVPVSEAAEAALIRADELLARDHALHRLVGLLDADGTSSTWRRAGLVAIELRRFSVAWQRIEAGHREARGEREAALAACLRAGCPGSQRKLFDLLAELRL